MTPCGGFLQMNEGSGEEEQETQGNWEKQGEPVKSMTFSNFRQLQGKKLLKTPSEKVPR